MAFSKKTRDILVYNSAYICNNPDCNSLTIASSDSDSFLELKIGEAAHIIVEKSTSARNESIDIE